MTSTPIRPPQDYELPRLKSAMAAGEMEGVDEDLAEFDMNGMDIEDALHGDREEPAQESQDGHGQSEESRMPKLLRSPIRPSAEDVEAHSTTHVPYRNWCPICVRARGKEDPHQRQTGEKRMRRGARLPKISMDYQELKSKAKLQVSEEDAVVRIIVAKDEQTGMTTAHRVDTKGPTDEWIVKRVVQDIEELGRSDIILKTDGEPAMVAVQRAVTALRKGMVTKPENPPSYNPQSNGAAEKAVQDVSAQIRTLKLALEARLGITINENSPIMEWIIEHGAYVLSRFSVGHDGMTPYERLTGRKWTRPMLEMGETVMAQFALKKLGYGKRKAQKNKLVARSIKAVWVGQVSRTGEQIVIKPNGDAARCRTVHRVPAEDRWDAEAVLSVKGTPRRPTPSQADQSSILQAPIAGEEARPEGAEDEAAQNRRREVIERRLEAAQDAESGAAIPQAEAREEPATENYRRFRITEALLLKYGASENCGGCARRHLGYQRAHSEACRTRIMEAMAADDADRVTLEREVVRLQFRAKKREEDAEALGGRPDSVDAPPVATNKDGDKETSLPSVHADFYPSDAGVQGGMVPPADEPQPAKHLDDNDAPMQTSGAGAHSNRTDIPELEMEDEDMNDEDMNVSYEPSSPGQSPGAANQEGGQAHHEECPDAKRSRLSRISMLQSLCSLNKLKKRSDVRAITQALDKARKYDHKCSTSSMFDVSKTFSQLLAVQSKIEKLAVPPEEAAMDRLYCDATFIDDVTGKTLDKTKAVEARKKEVEYFKTKGVYIKTKRQPGMKIIATKWLDVNKGDNVNIEIRARLVGCEIAYDKRDDLFAATPPLESLRMIIAICASHRSKTSPNMSFIVMTNDVSRAYFYAPATRPIFIEIPAEDREPGDDGNVAQLNLSLYGTRDAAKNWAKKYTEVMLSLGFEVGQGSPCNFRHRQRRLSCTVHGDDFTSTGTEENLKWFQQGLANAFEIKTKFLGPDKDRHQQEVRVLNRILAWTDGGLTYEADPRHAEIIIRDLGLEACKPVTTPGAREDVAKASFVIVGENGLVENEGGGELLGAQDATRFRALTARGNYLALDRADIQFAVKELSRRMSAPRSGDMDLLKRLGRYLAGTSRAVYTYPWQTEPSRIDTFVDSDWAGCHGSRRSTSGGAMMWGRHVLKSWSSTQATIALSSAEAELYALVKGAAQTLGMIALARDLGVNATGRISSDASAALGIVQRQGLGKLRHISTQFLWVQEKVRNDELNIVKVPGTDNPADLLTKNVSAELVRRHTSRLGIVLGSGRAVTAPQLSAFQERQHDDAQGTWKVANGAVARLHDRPRRQLFTPLRVSGAPPAEALTPMRVTTGRFVSSGRVFSHTDDWTRRADAHCELEDYWVGKTEFFLKTPLLKNANIVSKRP